MVKKTVKDQGKPILNQKIRAYIDLLRPATLFTPFIAGLFGILIQLGYTNQPSLFLQHWKTVIYAGVTLMLAQACGQCFNQSVEEEIKIDRVNKPYRPLVKGTLSKNEARSLAWILALIAIGRSFTINPWFGGFVTALVGFGIFYSLPPLRMKKKLFWGTAWQAFSRGFLPILTMWSVFGNPINRIPVAIGSILFVFMLGAQPNKDIVDQKGDKRYGVKSLITEYGVEKTMDWTSRLVAFGPLLLIALYTQVGILPKKCIDLFCLAPLLWFMAWEMRENPKKEIDKLENTVGWVLMYVILALFYIGFSLAFIL